MYNMAQTEWMAEWLTSFVNIGSITTQMIKQTYRGIQPTNLPTNICTAKRFDIFEPDVS